MSRVDGNKLLIYAQLKAFFITSNTVQSLPPKIL
jgi:hypothetical protein